MNYQLLTKVTWIEPPNYELTDYTVLTENGSMKMMSSMKPVPIKICVSDEEKFLEETRVDGQESSSQTFDFSIKVKDVLYKFNGCRAITQDVIQRTIFKIEWHSVKQGALNS